MVCDQTVSFRQESAAPKRAAEGNLNAYQHYCVRGVACDLPSMAGSAVAAASAELATAELGPVILPYACLDQDQAASLNHNPPPWPGCGVPC